jgi:photosystem II oxygen-evolving enhancer protein 3
MNAETGTHSFLQKGIYLGADIGPQVSAYKLKQCTFDLLATKDLIYQGDVWPHIRRYLCLKSTIMYYNFDMLIAGITDEQKPALTSLANRLFDNAEMVIIVVYYELLIMVCIYTCVCVCVCVSLCVILFYFIAI